MPTEFSLAPRFEPGTIESKWYAWWLEQELFTPTRDIKRRPYTVMIPPPNVTGQLHLGHALNNTLQDVMVRMKRMQGFNALWLPGTDHAGIATQAVVERKIFEEEGKTRIELGREEFVGRIWAWKHQYEERILSQLKQLGCSCDWSRTRFTLDEGLSLAVREAFVRMWNDGHIYRGPRIVNWDCALQTAVSDDEIEMVASKGVLATLKYPLKDSPERFIEVATTRPETMFGDTAVAVHPADPRYQWAIGRMLTLPLHGREIPVIADDSVEMEFGTGAVKVTPGHDPADWERGQRYRLPTKIVFNKDGTLNDECGPYAGLQREPARKRVLADLEAKGLLTSVKEHEHNVPRSDRSKTVIEPMVSEEWFVAMRELVKPAIAAARDGTLKFTPKRWAKTYLDWLENVHDWCISRQLWWGHRIPVWYDADGAAIASVEDLAIGSAHPRTGKPIVRQDEAVLDTWFSSALWPFSTLGWPEKSADLGYFYSTDALFTSRDIIYLWVARMVIQGYQFTGKCPFEDVYIHPTVLDEHGQRMSKSKGNGVDPLDMVEIYGVDSLRFSMASLATENQDCRLSIERDKSPGKDREGRSIPGKVKGVRQFENARNFINKIWNACRFALGNLNGFAEGFSALSREDQAQVRNLGVTAIEDKWILSRLAATVEQVTAALDGTAGDENGEGKREGFRFHDATQTLYHFIWNEFCDWYLELVKSRLYDGKGGAKSKLMAQAVLARVMDAMLRLMHPFTPFVSEEIWQALRPQLGVMGEPGSGPLAESICVAKWPKAENFPRNAGVEGDMEALQTLIRGVRAVRADHEIQRKTKVPLLVSMPDPDAAVALDPWRQEIIQTLCEVEPLEVKVKAARPKLASTIVIGSMEAYVPLADMIDPVMEKKRLVAKLEKLRVRVQGLKAKLENPGYTQRAAPELVAETREMLAADAEELRRTELIIEDLAAE